MKMKSFGLKLSIFILFVFVCDVRGRLADNKPNGTSSEIRSPPKKKNDGASLLLADELKVILERYIFGICPPTFKILNKNKNTTSTNCDLDVDQQDLAGRLATLSLRAHSASRGDCSRLGTALANTFGELARTAAVKQQFSANNEANRKRKLSKSQKLKIAAKQRTALAVKKKAAATAAAAAAKAISE